MEQKTGNSTLPKWCHTVLPQDGSLVIVTYGDSGYRSSPFESGNREENRRIADRENRKLGKISLQQEKTMLAGALLGWEPLADMEQISEENEPWEILVVREDVNGVTKGSVVEMPATQYEIYDALDRAYLPAEEKDIQVEIREGGLPILDERIDPHTNIFELNNFIQRYFKLDERENADSKNLKPHTIKSQSRSTPCEMNRQNPREKRNWQTAVKNVSETWMLTSKKPHTK